MTQRKSLKYSFKESLLISALFIFFFQCSAPSKDNSYINDEPSLKSEQAIFNDYVDSVMNQFDYRADLEEIKKRDTLKAITTYSSTSYFLYRGEPMGYEYELSKRLAEYLDVELEMIIAENIDEIITLLNRGDGDIIAYNLTVTKLRKAVVDFSLPLNFTHQVLVQRKPDNWRQMKLHEIEKALIRNPIKMIGLPIAVRENSSYKERLINLEDELGGDIDIQYLPGNLTTDEILSMVNDTQIDYTVSDYNIAKINASYYQNLDIETTVGVMQQLAWSIRKTSPNLKEEVNKWLKMERAGSDFYSIYNKYFKNSRAFRARSKSEFYSLKGDKISEFDELIKATAKKIDWDWRLLSALINQESKFDPKGESWVGAVGLMQLMPRTAKSYGFINLKNPKTNLKAGAAHIEYLENYWAKHIEDKDERIKFILGSYNVGHNHVQDARRLAEKYHMDPNIWYDNVDKALVMKSKKKYFNLSIVKYGYCRGEEPKKYVEEIFERYAYYQEFVPTEAEQLVGMR